MGRAERGKKTERKRREKSKVGRKMWKGRKRRR